MHILHIVHQYFPEYVGGTELYTQTLARYQVQQQGHRVAVFHPSRKEPSSAPDAGPIQHREDDGTHIYAVPLGRRTPAQIFFSTFRQPALNEALAQVLEKERPGLVHVQHLMGLPVSILNHFRAAGLPIVVTLHDYWFPCANGQLVTNYDNSICDGPRWWLNCGRCALARASLGDHPYLAATVAPVLGARSQALRRALESADRIIAPTRFVQRTYEALGMPMQNSVVVPHGIEVPQHVLNAAKNAGESPERDSLHIVYVGSLAWQKGLHVLVEAVNQLPHEGVCLSIYGDLDKFPEYVAHLKDAAVHPGIRFAGRIARRELWRILLQEADVAVLPTLWYEASPLTIQEMFAARVPLLASDIGALPEKIRDGVDGLLFPPGDARALADHLLRLHREPGYLAGLRSNIQETRLMEDHVEEIRGVYDEVLGSSQ